MASWSYFSVGLNEWIRERSNGYTHIDIVREIYYWLSYCPDDDGPPVVAKEIVRTRTRSHFGDVQFERLLELEKDM